MAVGKEALGATPPFQNPLERIGHTVREIPVWAGRHWKSLLLIVAAGGAAGSLYFLHDSGPQKAPVQPANPATDTFKPANPDPGVGSEVVVPAVPTPAENPIPPTAAATAEPEPPESTKTPPKEKPTSLTAANFNEFVGTVSKDEFKKLAKSQSDAFAFPVKTLGSEFQVTYVDKPAQSPSSKGNYKAIDIVGSDILLTPVIDGEIVVRRDDRSNPGKVTSIWVFRQLSENTSLIEYIWTGDSTNVSLMTNTDSPEKGKAITTPGIPTNGAITYVGPAERGNALARISGKVGFDIYLHEKLTQPIIINRPDGGRTDILAYTTSITPSIFENSDWISQNGKAVTSQN